jgi:hypothetical protein
LVKIRVKLGAAEVEVEADPEHLKEAIDLIPELVNKLPGSTAPRQETTIEQLPTTAADGYQKPSPNDLPVVTIEKSDSLADIIGKFFAGSWGREKRKLLDVRSALQSYGLNYPKQSVAVALLRLAKATKIRRFKAEDGEYVYTSSTAFFSPAVQTQPIAEETPGQLPLPE